jgi:hypothetical protein
VFASMMRLSHVGNVHGSWRFRDGLDGISRELGQAPAVKMLEHLLFKEVAHSLRTDSYAA